MVKVTRITELPKSSRKNLLEKSSIKSKNIKSNTSTNTFSIKPNLETGVICNNSYYKSKKDFSKVLTISYQTLLKKLNEGCSPSFLYKKYHKRKISTGYYSIKLDPIKDDSIITKNSHPNIFDTVAEIINIAKSYKEKKMKIIYETDKLGYGFWHGYDSYTDDYMNILYIPESFCLSGIKKILSSYGFCCSGDSISSHSYEKSFRISW